MTTLFDTPPTGEQVLADLSHALVLMLTNARPDDAPAALRAAQRVKAGRKVACGEVYDYLRAGWPDPMSGVLVVSRFLGKMADPLRRLRELREAMVEVDYAWRLVNVDGTWTIEAAS